MLINVGRTFILLHFVYNFRFSMCPDSVYRIVFGHRCDGCTASTAK